VTIVGLFSNLDLNGDTPTRVQPQPGSLRPTSEPGQPQPGQPPASGQIQSGTAPPHTSDPAHLESGHPQPSPWAPRGVPSIRRKKVQRVVVPIAFVLVLTALVAQGYYFFTAMMG